MPVAEIMEVILSDGFTFPVPFTSIYLEEKNSIERLHRTKTKEQNHLLGQARLSERFTIIITCYLLTSILEDVRAPPKTFFYLCKTQQRKAELKDVLVKVRKFVERWLKARSFTYFDDLKIMTDVEIDEGKGDESAQKHHLKCPKIFLVTSKYYLSEQLSLKQLLYWERQKVNDICIPHVSSVTNYFSKLTRSIDFIFLESNDFESLIDDVFSKVLTEHTIRCGWNQCYNLVRYYNYRQSNPKLFKKVVENRPAETPIAKDKIIVIDQSTEKKENSRQMKRQQVSMESSGSKKEILLIDKGMRQPKRQKSAIKRWKIENYDEKMNSLIQYKLENLKTSQAYFNNLQQRQYLSCYFLFGLELCLHLCSFLFCQLKQLVDPNHQTTDKFLSYACEKSNLRIAEIKKLKKLAKNFLLIHPPKASKNNIQRSLPSRYMFQILRFFEKLCVWPEIFDLQHSTDKFIMIRHEKEMNSNNNQTQEPWHLKSYCEQQFKLTTFNHKILMDLLVGTSKSLCCFQNHAYSQQYFEHNFKMPSLRYWKPKPNSQSMTNLTIGLVVNSNPNDEDMIINSYKMQQKEQILETQQKKQASEHYWQMVRTYGVMLFDLCDIVQDGIVVYFPSMTIMKECRSEWEAKENIYQRIYNKKRIFQEQLKEVQNQENVQLFRKYCHLGRGAIFFLSAQSQFGKYQTFFGALSRCVVFVGVPYPTISQEIQARFSCTYPKTYDKIHDKGHDRAYDKVKMHSFCFRQAMRVVARCMSNCVNDPTEMKIIIFGDANFRKDTSISKWFPLVQDGTLNSGTVIERVSFWLRRPQLKKFPIQKRQAGQEILVQPDPLIIKEKIQQNNTEEALRQKWMRMSKSKPIKWLVFEPTILSIDITPDKKYYEFPIKNDPSLLP